MVTRYKPAKWESPDFLEDKDGAYVSYLDYKDLETENQNLEFENMRLWKLVDEMQSTIDKTKDTTHEYTSSRVASIAARLLQDDDTPPDVKTIAASVLTQARDRDDNPTD